MIIIKPRIYDKSKVITDLKDPDGWTVENNPHPAPDIYRQYPDSDGEHWSDYTEYYGDEKFICHRCIQRAKYGSGNCVDGGEYFQCVTSGRRDRRRKEFENKHIVQSTLL